MTKKTIGKCAKCLFNFTTHTMSPSNQIQESFVNSAHDTALIRLLFYKNSALNATIAKSNKKKLSYNAYTVRYKKKENTKLRDLIWLNETHCCTVVKCDFFFFTVPLWISTHLTERVKKKSLFLPPALELITYHLHFPHTAAPSAAAGDGATCTSGGKRQVTKAHQSTLICIFANSIN